MTTTRPFGFFATFLSLGKNFSKRLHKNILKYKSLAFQGFKRMSQLKRRKRVIKVFLQSRKIRLTSTFDRFEETNESKDTKYKPSCALNLKIFAI